ncbi:hypothetical protein PPS11_08995 [Pseudomonas putida S11]|nr:hypothetical protein PPS11_08995 [Pseudomonas putida S11]
MSLADSPCQLPSSAWVRLVRWLDCGQMATCAVRAIVEGNDVELVRVQVMALLRKPLADGAVGFTIGGEAHGQGGL